MHRSLSVPVVVALTGLFTVGVAGVSQADASHVCSEPTGVVCVTSDAGTDISKDRDGDYTTATNSDDVGAYWGVANHSDQTQTVQIRLELDGPGTSEDTSFTSVREIAPGRIAQGSVELFKVHKKRTPKGVYSWTVTGNGIESASATSTFTVY